MNRKEAHEYLFAHGITIYEFRTDMLDLAEVDGTSQTVKGITVTYNLNAGAGFECWDARHDQTLRFRAHDIVFTPSGLRCEVIGYTSFATHTVALMQIGGQHDRRRFSEHESVLTLDGSSS